MNVLLINPWIYDFAAFDLWAKPLGLLYIADALRKAGCKVSLIDCLDRKHPGLDFRKDEDFGCGQYYREEIEKPLALRHIPRKYKRYGIPVRLFENELEGKDPDIVLVSSGMTYWYPGAFKAIEVLKRKFRGVPVLLGGVYATICEEHARKYSGAEVFPGGDIFKIAEKVFKLAGKDFNLSPKGSLRDNLSAPVSAGARPRPDGYRGGQSLTPAYDLYPEPEYAAIRTSWGCPFRCTYCAAGLLAKNFSQREPLSVANEIEFFFKKGIKDFAFYDDALLFNAGNHIAVILKELLKRKINCGLHTPNGLHARYVSEGIAELMRRADFIQPRLSLETSSEKRQKETGAKVTNKEFEKAVKDLYGAGTKQGETGEYVMMGMPGQDLDEVRDSIIFASDLGVKVFLSEYSPIPGTRDWQDNKFEFNDPLLHNNSIFPLYGVKDWGKLQQLKDLARDLNKK